MIDAELRSRIRRLFYAEHWKVGTIAAELGVHHEAVARAVEVERFANIARQVRPTLLDPYKDFIEQTLKLHPRLRSTRLHEMIRERGYSGAVAQLRRYVATIRPTAKREAYLRLVTFPGEQAQVDWGSFGKIKIGRAERSLSCFVMVLSWSRAMYARFALDQTLESFLCGHIHAFSALGGVPRGILYDNLKSVVLERQGDHIRFHPHLLDFAGHYHFAPKPCAPYRGNEKGKVERTIQYLRHAFFAARRFSCVEDLNAQLADWIAHIAHARPQPGNPERRSVADALSEERERLLPLPEHSFGTDQVRDVASGKQPYIRFDLNDYSIPDYLVGKPLTLIAAETEVRIVNSGGHVFACHPRSYDRGAVIEDPAHIEALREKKQHAHELSSRDRLRQSCPSANAFLDGLCRRSLPLASQVSRLLKLLDHYGPADLDRALVEAIERGALSADSVTHVLDQRARQNRIVPAVEVVLPDDPRVRDLRVTPHALGPYDALSINNTPEVPDESDESF